MELTKRIEFKKFFKTSTIATTTKQPASNFLNSIRINSSVIFLWSLVSSFLLFIGLLALCLWVRNISRNNSQKRNQIYKLSTSTFSSSQDDIFSQECKRDITSINSLEISNEIDKLKSQFKKDIKKLEKKKHNHEYKNRIK